MPVVRRANDRGPTCKQLRNDGLVVHSDRVAEQQYFRQIDVCWLIHGFFLEIKAREPSSRNRGRRSFNILALTTISFMLTT